MMSYSNNLLILVRLGFLPPDFKYKELEKTIYYLLWEHFRQVCYYAEIKSLTPPNIHCKKIMTKCNFETCPIVARALKDYERKRRSIP